MTTTMTTTTTTNEKFQNHISQVWVGGGGMAGQRKEQDGDIGFGATSLRREC